MLASVVAAQGEAGGPVQRGAYSPIVNEFCAIVAPKAFAPDCRFVLMYLQFPPD